MKQHVMVTILSAGLSVGLSLTGCGHTVPPKLQEENASAISEPEKQEESSFVPNETTETADAVQDGPYGKISLSIPDGWDYDAYTTDSGESAVGMYGIRFHPDGVDDGYIELAYTDSFGVCGTGLKEETAVIAGQPVSIGTYDNNMNWDFISFREDYEHIIALAYDIDDWDEMYIEQIMAILDTLSFDSSANL